MALNSLVEIVGILVTLALSIVLLRPAAAYLMAQVSGIPGFILGMLAVVLAGAVISMLVRSTWGRLTGKPVNG